MKLNAKGISLIKHFEGCKLKAYQCSAGKWTIGWGNTFYEDGVPVKQGDVITQDRADKLFLILVEQFANRVRPLLTKQLNENQFSALVSFAYNVGIGRPRTDKFGPSGLTGSTLLRKVNSNPADSTIRDEFLKWNKAGGKVLAGLTRRRQAEADLYFSQVN